MKISGYYIAPDGYLHFPVSSENYGKVLDHLYAKGINAKGYHAPNETFSDMFTRESLEGVNAALASLNIEE